MAVIKTNNGYYRFKQINLVAGIKRINKHVVKKNLLNVKEVFDKEGLFFGLMFGTLLGAIRENDFIIHAADTDLFILSEDEEKFKSVLFELREIGFELIRYERSGLYSISRNNEYIDVYSMKPFSKGVRCCGGKYILEKYLLDTTSIDFLGSEFIVPKESKEFLEVHYGSNWETPIVYAKGDMAMLKIKYLQLKSILKRLLPNYVYQKMLLNHHKATYEDLLDRCKEMNIQP